MKRRNFVKHSSLIGFGSLLSTSLILGGQRFLNSNSRGFKSLFESSNLKLTKIPSNFQNYIQELKSLGFQNVTTEGYSYNGHLMVEAEKRGVLFSKKGVLFITNNFSGKHHIFLEEKHMAAFDELMYSYVEGSKQVGINRNSSDFLLPNSIISTDQNELSYKNKLGNQLIFKSKNKNIKILIS